jgi:hypothetical protein
LAFGFGFELALGYGRQQKLAEAAGYFRGLMDMECNMVVGFTTE